MVSSVPPVPTYIYVVIRLKMAESFNIRVGTTLLCHYGETNDIIPIGGLVQPSETFTYTPIRHCRHLTNFRIEQNDRLYIAQELDGFMDPEPVKISFFVTDVLCDRLKWGAFHHTLALVVAVTDNIDEAIVALERLWDLFFFLILLLVSRLRYVEILIISLFIIEITSVISLNVFIMVTLFLHEKSRIALVLMVPLCRQLSWIIFL